MEYVGQCDVRVIALLIFLCHLFNPFFQLQQFVKVVRCMVKGHFESKNSVLQV